MFSSLFGSKKKPQQRAASMGSNLNVSIQKIQTAQEHLEKREQHLEKQAKKLTDSAKAKLRKKDKKGAMYDLKRKKLLEKELSGIQNKKTELRHTKNGFGKRTDELSYISSSQNWSI